MTPGRIVSALKSQFNKFMRSNNRNIWLTTKHARIYVRKSNRTWNNAMRRCLDIANVSVDEDFQNKGIFSEFVEFVEGFGMPVYLESILNKELLESFLKKGYRQHSTDRSCIIKEGGLW